MSLREVVARYPSPAASEQHVRYLVREISRTPSEYEEFLADSRFDNVKALMATRIMDWPRFTMR